MITIFSNPNATKTEPAESRKESYWLEKLFKQREKKIKDERRETLSAKRHASQTSLQKSQAEQESEEQGQEEAVKSHFRKIGMDQHNLEDMIAKSNRIIMSISSVFPWDFFPDSINVEETRVTIIQRQLFASQVHSVDIKNISNVFLDKDIFLASLTIVSSTFKENEIEITKLRKGEADLTRRLIEGLRMFIEKDIDTSRYTTQELISKLEDLSTTETVF